MNARRKAAPGRSTNPKLGQERAFQDRPERRGERGSGEMGRSGKARGSGEMGRSGKARGARRDSGATAGGRRPERRSVAGTRDSTPRSDHRSDHSDEPALADHIDARQLDPVARAELRTLSKPNAERVARHLVAAGELLDVDGNRALAHARAARARAARIAVVREAVGIAAYRAGEWSEALSELRAARRISGDPRDLALIADCERALGRPQQAIRLLNDPDARRLDPETHAELLIVVAGARRDLGQTDAALTVLSRGGLDQNEPRPGAMRLWYAYADALLAAGRRPEAAQWFAASAGLDVAGETDAAERALSLT